MNNEPKQVIVIRKDLKMRRGKECAQAAHASMAAILNTGKYVGDTFQITLDPNCALEVWFSGKFTKIVVSVNSEEELLAIQEKAINANLRQALITDCGATEFHGVPTKTCLAIGPDWPDNIDPITNTLSLL